VQGLNQLQVDKINRYDLVQGLNQLQVDKITYTEDQGSASARVSNTYWQAFPAFDYQPLTHSQTLRQALPAGGILMLWLALLMILVVQAGGRLTRGVR